MKNDEEMFQNNSEQLNEKIGDQIKVHKRKYYLYLIGLVLLIIILVIVLIFVFKKDSDDSDSEEEVNKEDKVESLPYYEYKKSKFYSGYLNASDTKFFHYIYVEAEKDKDKKPLVLWLNGGPGCSSLNGWATENGPYTIKDNEDNFTENKYSWNKEANMLYIESPGNVGFSYINSNKPEDFEIDDDISAEDNYNALKNFFKKFPNLKQKPFYISGESYAGVYVPRLAEYIIENNNKDDTINLKGILIGNPLVNPASDVSNSTRIDFMFFHHLISYQQRMDYINFCVNQTKEPECTNLRKQINNITKNINAYDILQKCHNSSNLTRNNFYLEYDPWNFNKLKKKFKATQINCVNVSNIENYFLDNDVQDALHVKRKTFELCNMTIFKTYNMSDEGGYEAIKTLIENKINILVYSGDTDLVVPFTGNQLWIKSLNLPLKEKWKSWKLKDENDYIAGYKVVYDGLTFVTVRGTGHMVPQWKPKEALQIFKEFINEKSQQIS